MTVNKLLFVLFIFTCGHLACMIGDGLFIGGANGDFILWLNNLMGFQVVSDGSVWSQVIMPFSVVTDGLTKIFLWNYSCFTGGFFIVRLFLCLISAALTFGMLATIFGRNT
ncbi:MAG: hypothetical protein FWH42_01485 [Dehalococcoidia bacterium]|nr:hypothetical protein [Dehalococcoidia bacterium]